MVNFDIDFDKLAHRIYHKSNLLHIKFEPSQIYSFLKSVEASFGELNFDAIMIGIVKQGEDISRADIMNYSPTYNKRTPTLWKEEKPHVTYFKIDYHESEKPMLIFEREMLFGQSVTLNKANNIFRPV